MGIFIFIHHKLVIKHRKMVLEIFYIKLSDDDGSSRNKDVKDPSNSKYLPSGVGGLGFLGCSGGFLGFIDSSISFSLSAAAFSFISKSFRLFSTLIFSFVANSLRKKSVILQAYKTPRTPDGDGRICYSPFFILFSPIFSQAVLYKMF